MRKKVRSNGKGIKMSKVNTFANEAKDFMDKHKDLTESKMVLGGVAWGFLRALAECPDCPGVYRIPDNEEWDHLYCPSCKNVWTHKSVIEE